MNPAVERARSGPPPTLRRLLARLLAVLLVALAAYSGWTFCEVCWLRWFNPGTTSFMQDGLRRLQARYPQARLQHRWVPYERISINLKRAVIAAEDQKFLEHDGFDVEEMQKAYVKNLRSGRVRRGGSTISQQLAKNLFLSPPRTYLRKIHEAVITLMLEHVLGKRRILELYLNVIEWGEGIYGAEAAAEHYYGEAAADLDPEEAARLAAMIPQPRDYTNNPRTPYLDQQTDVLLDEMDRVRVP